MMYLSESVRYIIDVVLGILLFMMIARLLLDYFRCDYYDPMCQAIVRITNPIAMILKSLPRIAGINSGILILGFLISFLKIGFASQFQLVLPAWLVVAFANYISTVLTFVFWILLARVVMSWLNPSPKQPGVKLVYQITEPMMSAVRRLLPAMGGLDLSPILLFVGIHLLRLLVVSPLYDLAGSLS